ncbi:hypothetical protein JCM33374_g5339 [Metschnikowia sp. JCM 33374]|nr:hypothetical protein JCM33374_g5339 [Metschnikowia sp. JCM 33374]
MTWSTETFLTQSNLLKSIIPAAIIAAIIRRYLASTPQPNDESTGEEESSATEAPSTAILNKANFACDAPAPSISVSVSASAAAADASFAFGIGNNPNLYLTGRFSYRTTSRFFPSTANTACATQCIQVNEALGYSTTSEYDEFTTISSDPFAIAYVDSIIMTPPNSA